MAISTVRRIAAKLLGTGENRIKINPGEVTRAEEALTTDDVRQLLKEGIVWAVRVKGVPRIRAKIKQAKKKQGRRSGSGSKKGAKYSRVSKKEQWKLKTRLQRRVLKRLKDSNQLNEGVYRNAYRMVKGNAWRSGAAMLAHFKDAKWLKDAPPRDAGRPAAEKAGAKQDKE